MKRKVNRVGQNTLTVSLPSKWVKENHIERGDSLVLVPKQNTLKISTTEKKTHSSIHVDITNYNKTLVKRIMDHIYLKEIQKVILTFKNQDIADYRHKKRISIHKFLQKLSERFIGLEIVNQQPDRIVYQNMFRLSNPKNIEQINQRVAYLLQDFLHEFMMGLKKDPVEFQEICKDYHDRITKFIGLHNRITKQSNLSAQAKTSYYLLNSHLDKIADKIVHAAKRAIQIRKPSLKLIEGTKELLMLLKAYFQILLKKKLAIDSVDLLWGKRYSSFRKLTKINFSKDDLFVLQELRTILDLCNNFTEVHLAVHMREMVDED